MKQSNPKQYGLKIAKTFLVGHPRKGEKTMFRENIQNGIKLHTIRENYAYWSKRIDKILETEGVLKIQEWLGVPYRSKPLTIGFSIPTYYMLQFRFCESGIDGAFIVDTQELSSEEIQIIDDTDFCDMYSYPDGLETVFIPIENLSTNDGLTTPDFQAWFAKAAKDPLKKYILIVFDEDKNPYA